MNAPSPSHDAFDVLCIGGINMDRKLKALQPLLDGSSNPCIALESPGGVARNVAENLARLGLRTQLIGALGADSAAQTILNHMQSLGVSTSACLFQPAGNTGSYTAVLDANGQLVVGMADMAITEQLTPDLLLNAGLASSDQGARLWMADMNLPEASLKWLAQHAREQQRRLVMLAVSEPKMERLPHDLQGVDTLVLNRGELAAWRDWFDATTPNASAITLAEVAVLFAKLQAAGLQRLVVTLGETGVVCIETGQAQPIHLRPESPPAMRVVDVSGAGDALCAGLCASYLRYPEDALVLHVKRAMKLAVLTVQSEQTASAEITPDLI
jgi:pseudouridine kinase